MEATVRPDGAASDIDLARLAFEAALRSGDAAAAADVYVDDAILLAPDADILRGRSAIQQFWQTGIETGVEEIGLVVRDVERRGEAAFEVGDYALHYASESGDRLIDHGRYLVVLRVEADGSWRRAAEMFSPDRHPALTTSVPYDRPTSRRSPPPGEMRPTTMLE